MPPRVVIPADFKGGNIGTIRAMNGFLLQLISIMLAGSVNQHHLRIIEYQREEIRVLRELHGKRRLRFTDDQRRRYRRPAC